jgi:hypothetical protein
MTSTTLIQCSLDDLRQLLGETIYKGSFGTIPAIEVIDRAELCRRLDISEQTAITWERKGKIPCFRIGGAVRYNYPKVIEALEEADKIKRVA